MSLLLCTICMESTETINRHNGYPVKPRTATDKILKCGHVYHGTCIQTWIKKNEAQRPLERPTCPCCRRPITNRHRVLWIRFLLRQYTDNECIVDKYIYYEYTHMILFVNDVKQWKLHYSSLNLFKKTTPI